MDEKPMKQSSEPILLPKLRIEFADFPYLHYPKTRGFSPRRPDAVMGTHIRIRLLIMTSVISLNFQWVVDGRHTFRKEKSSSYEVTLSPDDLIPGFLA